VLIPGKITAPVENSTTHRQRKNPYRKPELAGETPAPPAQKKLARPFSPRMTTTGMRHLFIYDPPPAAHDVEKNPDLLPHVDYVRRAVAHLSAFKIDDPAQAACFVVPVNLIHFQFHKPQLDPWDFLKNLPHLDRGPHVLWATGDYGQRKRGPYESFHEGRAYPHLYEWLDERFRLVLFESTPEVSPADIPVLPYVLNPARPGWWERLLTPQPPARDLLYSFSGALSYAPLLPEAHIRGGVFTRMAGHGKDFFIGSPATARKRFGRRGSYRALFERSVFTLSPAGFGRWTFRLGEALHYGSIPVVIANDYVLPYADKIPWDQLIIRCPEKDALSVADRLRSISKDEIAHRQQKIAEYRPHFTETGIHEMLARTLVGTSG